ncbi:MAG: Hsp20/alpha crystallin family protein [Candidatus Odinarchaeota archaeon]
MSDIKEEKKVDIKTDEKEDIKEEQTEKKGELQVRNRYRPLSIFRDIDRFFDDMDKFFVDFWRPSRFWNFEPFTLSLLDEDNFFRTPLTNIVDEGDHFSVTAELPGLEKGNIEISVHNGALEIKGEQKNELEDKKEGYLRREYNSSSYYRSFKLPENIDEDKIEAKLEKGVLKLSLPKIEEEKKEKKKIEVK